MNLHRNVSTHEARSLRKAAWYLTLAAAALVSLPARATLGGNSASVTADQTAFNAALSVSKKADYSDYALTLANGIVVHEFVNAANQVFEVTWSGKGMRPDMRQLLGGYFTRFGSEVKQQEAARRRADKTESDFEVHTSVRNRWFSGTAHVPAQLPTSLPGPLAVPVESTGPGATTTSGAASE